MAENVVAVEEKESNELKKPDGFLTSFIRGAQKGVTLVYQTIIPNAIFAFIIIILFENLGVMDLLSRVLSPVMGLFGLSGETIVPMGLAYVSTTGGIVALAGLFSSGIITAHELTIVFPFIFLVGASVQYLGRVLGPSGIATKWYGHMFAISTINGIISIFVMRILLAFM